MAKRDMWGEGPIDTGMGATGALGGDFGGAGGSGALISAAPPPAGNYSDDSVYALADQNRIENNNRLRAEYDAWIRSQSQPPPSTLPPGTPPPGFGSTLADFSLPGYEDFMARARATADAAAGRTAPTMGFTGMQAPQMGPLSTYAGARLGAAPVASAAPVGPAATAAADSPFRGAQQSAMDYHSGLMRGENSIADLQAQRHLDQLVAAQTGMAAGAGPSERARAQRTAANAIAAAGSDIAGRALEAGLQERANAAGALGAIAGQGRAGDIQLGTFNAGESNQNQRLGAQLGTSANLANAEMAGRYGITQAGLDQQAGLTAAEAANQRQYQQAGMDMSASQFNADAANAAARSNLEAELRTMGLNDDQIAQMMQLQGTAMANQQEGSIAYGRLAEDARQAEMNDTLQRYLQDLRGQQELQQIAAQRPSTLERLGGAGMGLLQLAPEYLKLFGVGAGGSTGDGGGGSWGGLLGAGMDALGEDGGGDDLNWMGGLSGAASGAAMGSAFGPIGTGIGGVIGGLGGLFR